MNDVSVVRISHGNHPSKREYEQGAFDSVGFFLSLVELGPQDVVNSQDKQKGKMRRGQVEDEAFLMSG